MTKLNPQSQLKEIFLEMHRKGLFQVDFVFSNDNFKTNEWYGE